MAVRIALRWNIVSVAFFFRLTGLVRVNPLSSPLSFLAVWLWASHSTSLGVEKIYLWKIRELD